MKTYDVAEFERGSMACIKILATGLNEEECEEFCDSIEDNYEPTSSTYYRSIER